MSRTKRDVWKVLSDKLTFKQYNAITANTHRFDDYFTRVLTITKSKTLHALANEGLESLATTVPIRPLLSLIYSIPIDHIDQLLLDRTKDQRLKSLGLFVMVAV